MNHFNYPSKCNLITRLLPSDNLNKQSIITVAHA